MDTVLAAFESTPVAQYLRSARWSYAVLNGTHILAVATLVGAILALNVRLLGFRREVAVDPLASVLIPVVVAGLILAVASGVLLFSVRATEYAGNPFLQLKLGLVVIGVVYAAQWQLRYGRSMARTTRAMQIRHGALSTLCWVGALFSGRLIAFFE